MLFIPVARPLLHMIAAFPAESGAPEAGPVRVNHDLVIFCIRHSDVIYREVQSGQIQRHQFHLRIRRRPVRAVIGEGVVLGIIRIDPAEPLHGVILLPHGRMLLVEMIQFLYEIPELPVLLIVQQHPVQFLLLVPFNELSELRPHEHQLLPRMGHHIDEEGPEAGELIIIFSRHLAQHGTLAVNHFIVGNRQNEILTVCIGHGERQIMMHPAPENRILGEIRQRVIHPSHIPLIIESQAPVLRRTGHHRPGGGFLGDHHDPREGGQNVTVDLPQEVDRLQILSSAVLVRRPFPCLPVIIQIQHGRHCIHPEAVDMIDITEEERIRNEEAQDFRPAEVEGPGAPSLMFHPVRFTVLIQMMAVEIDQSVGVLREMRRHPVHDNADARPVATVHEIFEIIRGAVPGRDTEISGDLVPPGSLERILGERHDFQVCVTHFLHIRNQLPRQFPVTHDTAVLPVTPGSQVHFIDIHRRLIVVPAVPAPDPFLIPPLVEVRQVTDPGCHLVPFVHCSLLTFEGVRIGLEHHPAVICRYGVFI